MNKKEAKVYFAETIKDPCGSCVAKVGELCDTPAVWVHMSRLLDASTKTV